MARTYYDVLQVKPSASQAEIQKAYRQMARRHHPDLHQGSKFHEEKFKEIVQAYQVLSDQHTKLAYDWGLHYRQQQQAPRSKADYIRTRRRSPPQTGPSEATSRYAKPFPYRLATLCLAGVLLLIVSNIYYGVFWGGHSADALSKWGLHEQALAKSPNQKGELQFLLGKHYLLEEQRAGAALYRFDKALEEGYRFSPVWMYAGIAYARLGLYEKASHYLRESLIRNVTNHKAQFYLGWINFHHYRDFYTAADMMERATLLQRIPGQDQFFVKAYRETGNGQKALEHLDAILQRHPKDTSAWRLMAETQQMLGNYQDACRWHQKLCRKGNPQSLKHVLEFCPPDYYHHPSLWGQEKGKFGPLMRASLP